MSTWPSVKAKRYREALERAGYINVSRHGGSHQKYVHPVTGKRIIYAFHDRATIKGSLLKILAAQAGLSREDF